jgi:hypothetical protein
MLAGCTTPSSHTPAVFTTSFLLRMLAAMNEGIQMGVFAVVYVAEWRTKQQWMKLK